MFTKLFDNTYQENNLPQLSMMNSHGSIWLESMMLTTERFAAPSITLVWSPLETKSWTKKYSISSTMSSFLIVMEIFLWVSWGEKLKDPDTATKSLSPKVLIVSKCHEWNEQALS